jgi:uncharacterized protein (DUF305 family)
MGRTTTTRGRGARATLVALLALATGSIPAVAGAQWVTVPEQFYLQASHNWVFRARHANADRLFNAFDFGHAILYEELYVRPEAPASRLEEGIYDRLVRQVLVRPPRVPLEEAAIAVRYTRLAPEAKAMFEWAHLLHRQLYDVLADERLSPAQQDAEVARLLRYYRSRPDLAFSARPKSMALMQEQPYSLAFRAKYPKFNGLIWGYHWLQVGLYEPLVAGRSTEARQAGVRAAVARFWQMIEGGVATLPHQMPMTAAVAPAFAARYPEAAIVFDNLHSMHDVISDILANPAVPRDAKRAEILRAAARFRDDTTEVMTEAGWRRMSQEMGVENMGGVATAALGPLPAPSVTRGAVMTHDLRTGAMTGFKSGRGVGGAHAGHDAHAGHTPPADSAGAARRDTRSDTRRDTRRDTVRHTPADAAFMQGMIGHHAQALVMAALVPSRSATPALRALAERIDVSQRDEIAAMRQWLADRGEPVPDSTGALPGAAGAHAGHEAHGGHAAAAMPGMLTPVQLAELAAASGAAFDRLFLRLMIQHHEGALVMVRDLLATPGAAREAQTFAFVSDVDTDQRAEIARMQALLTRLP